MILYLVGVPASTQYCRASLIAVSVASLPPDTKNTRDRPGGANVTRRSAARSWASDVNSEPWANVIRWSWRSIAARISGTPCPRFAASGPEEPSR